jgi:hypothetical protein
MTAGECPRRRLNKFSSQWVPASTPLPLLRQRLDRLFGRSFQLKVRTDIGQGTAVTIRIPLRGRFAIVEEAPDNATPAPKPKGL